MADFKGWYVTVEVIVPLMLRKVESRIGVWHDHRSAYEYVKNYLMELGQWTDHRMKHSNKFIDKDGVQKYLIVRSFSTVVESKFNRFLEFYDFKWLDYTKSLEAEVLDIDYTKLDEYNVKGARYVLQVPIKLIPRDNRCDISFNDWKYHVLESRLIKDQPVLIIGGSMRSKVEYLFAIFFITKEGFVVKSIVRPSEVKLGFDKPKVQKQIYY